MKRTNKTIVGKIHICNATFVVLDQKKAKVLFRPNQNTMAELRNMERKNVEPKRIMVMEIANPRIELDLKQNKIKSKFYFFNRSWDIFLSSHSRYFIDWAITYY